MVDALRTRRVDGGTLLLWILPGCAAEDLGLEDAVWLMALETILDETEDPASDDVVDTLRVRVVAALGVANGFAVLLVGSVRDESFAAFLAGAVSEESFVVLVIGLGFPTTTFVLARPPVGEAVLADDDDLDVVDFRDSDAAAGNRILDSMVAVVVVVVAAAVVFTVTLYPPEQHVMHRLDFPDRKACMRTIPCRGDSNFMAK